MFKLTDQHFEDYQTLGYTVFRGIIPSTLIDALRVQCDLGAGLVRATNPQAQRFQPIAKFDIDQKPFEEFQNLADIRDAVSRIIQIDWEPSGLDLMGVLIEPANDPYCMMWHRDWRDNIRGLDIKDWEAHNQDPRMFNQVNAALYEDSCTWVVPGSHLRADTDAEILRFPERPIPGPLLEGLGAADKERTCLNYLESLPGAKRILLDAGDYCIYRNTLWHTGNYTPYKKRATLHDSPNNPVFWEWSQSARKKAAERIAAGLEWENPNTERLAELTK